MTEQELNRLGRRDLLKLLLVQSRETETALKNLSEAQANAQVTEQQNQQLKGKLDDKDAQIKKLELRLEEKDMEISNIEKEMERVRNDRAIELEEAGSIAEASLRLSGVFAAAQDAADLYLENLKQRDAQYQQFLDESRQRAQEQQQQTSERCENLEAQTLERCDALEQEIREKCQKLEQETQERCAKLDEDTKSRCSALESDTASKCEQMVADAKQEANKVWESLTERIQGLYSQYAGLGELMDLMQTKQKAPEETK